MSERILDETCKVTLGDRARFERIVARVSFVRSSRVASRRGRMARCRQCARIRVGRSVGRCCATSVIPRVPVESVRSR